MAVVSTPTIRPVSGGCSVMRKASVCARKPPATPLMAYAASQPKTIPSKLPKKPINTASTRNNTVICSPSRPMVLSTAISVVRRLTITSIVFTIPMPPISSDTSPMTVTNCADIIRDLRVLILQIRRGGGVQVREAFIERGVNGIDLIGIGQLDVKLVRAGLQIGKERDRAHVKKVVAEQIAPKTFSKPLSSSVGMMPRTVKSWLPPLKRTASPTLAFRSSARF